MANTFTPPGVLAVPQISFADSKYAQDTRIANPQGYNLMRYFPMRERGVNVWVMSDGTVWMSDPVPGVSFTGTIGWVWPDTDAPINGTISSSWFPGGIGGVGGSGPGGQQDYVSPTIAYAYHGGRTYTGVPNNVVTILTAAGLGAYLS